MNAQEPPVGLPHMKGSTVPSPGLMAEPFRPRVHPLPSQAVGALQARHGRVHQLERFRKQYSGSVESHSICLSLINHSNHCIVAAQTITVLTNSSPNLTRARFREANGCYLEGHDHDFSPVLV